MIYQFADFTLDPDRFELRDGSGASVKLQPRAMHILTMLVQSGGRLVRKSRLSDEIWAGRAVGESALTSQVKALRQALGDTQRPYRIIGTVHGQGLRIMVPVTTAGEVVGRTQPGSAAIAPPVPAPTNDGMAEPLRGKAPDVAVLPLKVLGETDMPALAEALPDEIITALSQMRMMQVIARGTSFQYPSIDTPPARIAQDLGVDYMLSGTMEQEGGADAGGAARSRFRLQLELADTRNGRVVWSDEFSIPLAEVHELRSQIVGQVVSTVEREVPRNEVERSGLLVSGRIDAWQAYHRGMHFVFRRGLENNMLAQGFFERAVAADPDFARAHAGLAHTHWWLLLQRMLDDPGDGRTRMMDAAKAALAAAPEDPAALLAMGRALSISEDPQQAEPWLMRSIEAAPSYAWGHNQVAAAYAFIRPFEKGVEHGEKALSLSPRDPLRHSMFAALAVAHFNLGELETAAEYGRRAQELPHADLMVMATALSVNFAAGHRDVARRIADRIKQTYPTVTVAGIVRANPGLSEANAAVLKAIMSQFGIE